MSQSRSRSKAQIEEMANHVRDAAAEKIAEARAAADGKVSAAKSAALKHFNDLFK